MQCQRCKTAMVTRSGKFGAFMACPNSTISDNHGTKPLKRSSLSVGTASISAYRDKEPSFEQYVERQMMAFGVYASNLERFIIDEPDWNY